MARTVYLDNNATTQVDPRVLEEMLPYFGEKFGNAASRNHHFGWDAEAAAEQARARVAAVIGADPKEIVFTSGATEGNNVALKGIAAACAKNGRHIVTQRTEHRAVLDPCAHLERQGFRVTYLPVDRYGTVDLEELEHALASDTTLVSIMHGNNEIGTLQPIREIGRVCKKHGVILHTDCAQTFGKVPIDVNDLGIDVLTLSGHKIHGPKGVGVLYLRRRRPRVRCEPLIHGGGHERGMRSGTLPVPEVVGLGKAAEICMPEMVGEARRLARLRDRLRDGILSQVTEVYENGHPTQRTPTTLNLSFGFLNADAMTATLHDVACSNGSACAESRPQGHRRRR